MQYIIVFLIGLFALCAQLFQVSNVSAASEDVVISQVQLAGAGYAAAGQEFISIYNNASSDIDITNWCLTYTSSSGATTTTLMCIRPVDSATKIWLKARATATFVSPDLKNTVGGWQGDGTFSNRSGMASTGGRVRIIDASSSEVDRVSWGTMIDEATAPEPPAGKVLQRTGNGLLQDTDNSSIDFVIGVPTLNVSGIYETVIDVCPNIVGSQLAVPTGYMFNDQGSCVEIPPADVCPNINELQVQIPQGYLIDSNGNCQPDSCLNIEGLQVSIPDDYDDIGDGNCSERDVCINLEGAQHNLPSGYVLNDMQTGSCVVDLVYLEISEILPNPKGADAGKEYIEIYNPSTKTVDLEMYALSIGASTPKVYLFSGGTGVIHPGEYRVIRDSDIGFTLTNTSGRVVLQARDGRVFSDTGVYSSAPEDMAWAFVDGMWQYTDRPTPGAVNVSSLVEEGISVLSNTVAVANCPAGKYRNPLTNRCRNIESDASVLAACDSDQYRNPETGRCKKITGAATLAPCKDGQYRSEETNRCRAISTANATLTPCKQGQERNPETNRCRNVAASSIPAAAYAVEQVKDGVKAFIGWWAVGGIGVLALGYAGWEWRTEVMGLVRRIAHIKSSK